MWCEVVWGDQIYSEPRPVMSWKSKKLKILNFWISISTKQFWFFNFQTSLLLEAFCVVGWMVLVLSGLISQACRPESLIVPLSSLRLPNIWPERAFTYVGSSLVRTNSTQSLSRPNQRFNLLFCWLESVLENVPQAHALQHWLKVTNYWFQFLFLNREIQKKFNFFKLNSLNIPKSFFIPLRSFFPTDFEAFTNKFPKFWSKLTSQTSHHLWCTPRSHIKARK